MGLRNTKEGSPQSKRKRRLGQTDGPGPGLPNVSRTQDIPNTDPLNDHILYVPGPSELKLGVDTEP